jgi:hypothetical protein
MFWFLERFPQLGMRMNEVVARAELHIPVLGPFPLWATFYEVKVEWKALISQ